MSSKPIHPKNTLRDLFVNPGADEKLHQAEYMLMASYLSEIERIQKKRDHQMTRKELATRIGTSASYLTQVFRGDKPLNFRTLAKIQEALNIRFLITVFDTQAVPRAFSGGKISKGDNDLSIPMSPMEQDRKKAFSI